MTHRSVRISRYYESIRSSTITHSNDGVDEVVRNWIVLFWSKSEVLLSAFFYKFFTELSCLLFYKSINGVLNKVRGRCDKT